MRRDEDYVGRETRGKAKGSLLGSEWADLTEEVLFEHRPHKKWDKDEEAI